MTLTTVFTVLIVIASIILILVVLVQKSKGGGLASNFSSSNAIMGVRKTTDFIEKATWALAGFIIILSIASVTLRVKGQAKEGSVIENAPVQQNNIPGFPSSPDNNQNNQ